MMLADLLNRHAGATAWILGTGWELDGAVDDDWSAIREDPTCVVIALNRAIGVAPRVPDRLYWLVQDHAWAKGEPGPWAQWLADVHGGEGPIGVFMDPMYGPKSAYAQAPAGERIVHFARPGPAKADALLAEPPAVAAQRGQLFVQAGTCCTAMHLAAVLGCCRVVLVGCSGGNSRAECLQQWYTAPAAEGFGYLPARETAEKAARLLGMPRHDYIPRAET